MKIISKKYWQGMNVQQILINLTKGITLRVSVTSATILTAKRTIHKNT